MKTDRWAATRGIPIALLLALMGPVALDSTWPGP
jgi:hypothetical protein